MAKNRSIEQKKLKMKRRNRHAVFSGATTRLITKSGPIPFTEDTYGNTKTGAATRILVGPVSLSKQVMSTGRGPDAARMQEYYQRVHSYDQALPETIGAVDIISKVAKAVRSEGGLMLKELENTYANYIRGIPKEMRISLVNNHTGMLDLYFGGMQFFFVDVCYQTKTIRRSKIYASKKFAMRMLELKSITWVEQIPK